MPRASADKDPNAGFFAVDRRAWAFACKRGLLPAVAYLVQACGSGRDNRTTKWSANAVEKYTNASRARAAAAVEDLVDCGLSRLKKGGTHPHYYLAPAHEVPGCEGYPPSLTSTELHLLAELDADHWRWFTNRASRQWDGDSPFNIAQRLVGKGVAHQEPGGRRFALIPYNAEKSAEPDWIWLPNVVVTGAADETPPVAMLRATQNVNALRLFVDLYGSHSLAENGGIHWRQFRRNYMRHKVGESGQFVVWGFQKSTLEVWGNPSFVVPHLTGKLVAGDDGKMRDPGWIKFWEAADVLAGSGLLEYVGHVIEADTDTAEVVHSYAIGNGEPEERILAETAHHAGFALITPGQAEWAADHELCILPVLKGMLPNVALVGIPRLRYRPRTKATAAWLAKQQDWKEWRARYAEIAGELAADLQHQGKIKEASR